MDTSKSITPESSLRMGTSAAAPTGRNRPPAPAALPSAVADAVRAFGDKALSRTSGRAIPACEGKVMTNGASPHAACPDV
jgi:hypothetical protein